jgi:hypothetical protein
VTAPLPIASGDRLAPARLNGFPWTAYTPTWQASGTAPSLGNGLLEGRYRYLDDRSVAVRIRLQPGSTTTFGTGNYMFRLPVIVPSGGPDPLLQATGLMGGPLYRFVGWASAAGAAVQNISVYRDNVTASENLTNWTNALPVVFANGHNINMAGTYYLA